MRARGRRVSHGGEHAAALKRRHAARLERETEIGREDEVMAVEGLMKPVAVPLAEIYIPVKFRDTLDPKKVEALAESFVDKGMQSPINVRRDKERYVLVAGYHRLEAARSLGEKTIQAFVVRAPQR